MGIYRLKYGILQLSEVKEPPIYLKKASLQAGTDCPAP